MDLPGVSVLTSRMEQTNATVLRLADGVLVVDSPYFPDELDALRELAGAEVRLFATHSHFDHLLGRLAWPDAPLLLGPSTAAGLIQDREGPARDLHDEDSRTYVARERPLDLGCFDVIDGLAGVELIEADGHWRDGDALWAPEHGVLCPGDYLSDVEIPLISGAGSPGAYRATLARLEPLLDRARLVVPGHGSPCSGEEAKRRLEEDLRYLDTHEIPPARDTPRQREIHAANLERHGRHL